MQDPSEGPLILDEFEFSGLVMLEVPDWPGLDQLSEHTTSTVAKLCAATTLYGGIHVGAWNSVFPTASECLGWRMSAGFITGSGLAVSIVALMRHWKNQQNGKDAVRSFSHRYLSMSPRTQHAMMTGFREFVFCAHNLMIVGIVPTFIVARLYLVAEAFMSLRSLPIEAYQTPAWTQWIPAL